MKPFDWSAEKNAKLKHERSVSFEEVVDAVTSGRLLGSIANPNGQKYPNQKILIVEIDNYAYAVPCIEEEERWFLKTIYPSRRYTKQYLR